MALPKLTPRVIKYAIENPVRILEEFPYIKKTLYDPIVSARHKQALEYKEITKETNQFRKEVQHIKDSSRRLAIFAISQEEGGLEALRATGVKEIPRLTPEEMQVYLKVRKRFDEMFDRIQQARILLGEEPIGKIEFYFTFMRRISEVEGFAKELIFEPASQYILAQIREPRFEYLKPRVEKSDIPVELDFFKVYETYMKEAVRYTAVAPIISKAKLILNPIKFKEGKKTFTFDLAEVDRNLYNYLEKWVQFSTEKIAPSAIVGTFSPRVAKMIQKINENLAMAIMSYNARIILIQYAALRNSYIQLGERYLLEGIRMMFNPKWRDFANKNAATLTARKYDIHVEIIQKGFRKKRQKQLEPWVKQDLSQCKQ